jgi:putative ABC transport system ATP-binding protein
VDDVSLELRRGELVLIMGPSGSGKTTLLSMLGGLLRPTSGRISIDGEDITGANARRLADLRARKIGFIFQAFNLLPALSTEENIAFPATLVRGGGRVDERVRALVDRVGLSERRHARPRELSGGEKQRVAIARALINEPPLILADEPTGNLDSKHGQETTMLLYDLVRDEGRTVLIVTHDPRIEDVADRILWLEDGALRDRKAETHEWVVDPVCRMRIDAWTATARIEHAGSSLAFCSRRCRERFASDPGAYVGGEELPSPLAGLPDDSGRFSR